MTIKTLQCWPQPLPAHVQSSQLFICLLVCCCCSLFMLSFSTNKVEYINCLSQVLCLTVYSKHQCVCLSSLLVIQLIVLRSGLSHLILCFISFLRRKPLLNAPLTVCIAPSCLLVFCHLSAYREQYYYSTFDRPSVCYTLLLSKRLNISKS